MSQTLLFPKYFPVSSGSKREQPYVALFPLKNNYFKDQN